MAKSKPKCPNDGSVMYRDVKPLTLEYRGRTATAPGIPGWYCKKCDEAIYDPGDAKKASGFLNGLRAEVFGLLKPHEILRIRKKLGLSQKDAGMIIGGGLRAFQKYESGETLPSEAVNNVLLLLDRQPSSLSILRENFQRKADRMYKDNRPQA